MTSGTGRDNAFNFKLPVKLFPEARLPMLEDGRADAS
jgi:hypothetical protein